MKQIYGYTTPETAKAGYTGFLAAVVEDDGTTIIQIRQHEGDAVPRCFALPADEAAKLARAIYRDKKAREGGASATGDAED